MLYDRYKIERIYSIWAMSSLVFPNFVDDSDARWELSPINWSTEVLNLKHLRERKLSLSTWAWDIKKAK